MRSPPALTWDWSRLRSRCLLEARRVLPRAEAEEAVQEALVRAWAGRAACRTPEAPLPWLLEITRNEARRVISRQARRRVLELNDPAPLDADVEDDELASDRLTLAQALDRLGDTDQRVLRLRYDEDLTQVEVARRLGVPEGTVKVRLHRARRRLRALLEEQA